MEFKTPKKSERAASANKRMALKPVYLDER